MVTAIAPKAVKIADAARMLAVSTKTIRRMLADKRLKRVRIGRAVRVQAASIDAFMSA